MAFFCFRSFIQTIMLIFIVVPHPPQPKSQKTICQYQYHACENQYWVGTKINISQVTPKAYFVKNANHKN